MRSARFLAMMVMCLAASAAQAATALPPSFADLVEKLSPAVVNVSTTQKVKDAGLKLQFKGLPEGQEFDPFREFFEQFGERYGQQNQGAAPERNVTSLGSGFVIDPSGYVVTNHHVVAEADQVTVTFQDDSKFEAKIVGRDAKTDLALLKIDSKKPLPFVEFGDSDAMRVGDWVIAIGNPFGLGGSVSAGIVSARSRNINAGPFDDFIQTDAAINRGNSGGPLFNEKGEVIGVNSAIFSPTGGNVGIGFSIPAALAEPVLKQLREHGRTHRGWLGVKIQHVTDEIADSVGLDMARGALVMEVNANSPAQKAGVMVGDVVVAFDGKPIKEMRQLPRLVAESKVGTRTEMKVWRKGAEKTLSITLGEMDESPKAQAKAAGAADDAAPDTAQEHAGLSLVPIDAAARAQFRLKAGVEGLLVVAVKAGSSGADAGLQRGDVIVDANQEPVASVEQFRRALARAKSSNRNHALLRIQRGGTMAFITMKVK